MSFRLCLSRFRSPYLCDPKFEIGGAFMQFEARELPAYAEVVSPLELKEGSIYFSVTFLDEEMLIPTMEAFVYIGRDLESEDSGQLYFQDAVSHQEGVRYAMAADGDG